MAFGAVATAYFLQQLVEVQTRGFLDALVGRTAKITQQAVTATKAALGKLAVAGDLGPDADRAILKIEADFEKASSGGPGEAL